MKTWNWIAGLTAALACVAAARATEVKQEIDASGQEVYVTAPGGYARPAKFEEYRSQPNGLILERYALQLDTGTYRFGCEAKRVTLPEQSYLCSGGRAGEFTYYGGWNQTPHLYSNDARTLYNAKGGFLELPDGLSRMFEDNPGRFVSVSSGIASFLDGAYTIPLRIRDDVAVLGARYRLGDNLTMRLDTSRKHRTGNKAFGATLGFSNDIEVALPVDELTQEASLAVDYARQDRQLSFRYAISDFRNGMPDLQWDNPKRFTDRYSTGSGYSAGDQSRAGRLALAPDNRAHTVSLAGGIDLPGQSHFTAELGYARWSARNPMQPYTINSAINPANAAAAGLAAINTPPFQADDPANLPSSVIESHMNVYTQAYKLSTRGLGRLSASAEFKSYQVDNRSTFYEFPGFVRVDQAWEEEALDTREHRADYTKNNMDVRLNYEFAEPLSVGTGYGIEWVKRAREVTQTREDQVSGSATYRPTRKVLVNLAYLLGMRRMGGFDDQSYRNESGVFIELPGMRRFDISDRNRHRGRLQTQYMTDNATTVSFSAQATIDQYRRGQGDLTGGSPANIDDIYGLQDQKDFTLGTDVSVPVNDRWTTDFYYEWDYSRRIVHSNSTQANPPATQDPANDWTARMAETSNIGGVSLTWQPDQTWKASAGYELVASNLHTDPIAVGSGLSYQSPPPTQRFKQVLKLLASYRWAKNLQFSGRYAYEKFQVSDFALANVPLRPAAADAIYLGASLRGYYAHIVGVNANYRF